jgi:hypothetical protein
VIGTIRELSPTHVGLAGLPNSPISLKKSAVGTLCARRRHRRCALSPSVMRTLNAWSSSLTFHLLFVAAVTRNVFITLLTSQH